MRMKLADALAVLAEVRGDEQVVVTSMGAIREWFKRGTHRLDFGYMPSTMGGAPSF